MEFSVFLRCRVASHRYGDLDPKSFAGQYPGGRHCGDADTVGDRRREKEESRLNESWSRRNLPVWKTVRFVR